MLYYHIRVSVPLLSDGCSLYCALGARLEALPGSPGAEDPTSAKRRETYYEMAHRPADVRSEIEASGTRDFR